MGEQVGLGMYQLLGFRCRLTCRDPQAKLFEDPVWRVGMDAVEHTRDSVDVAETIGIVDRLMLRAAVNSLAICLFVWLITVHSSFPNGA